MHTVSPAATLIVSETGNVLFHIIKMNNVHLHNAPGWNGFIRSIAHL